MKKEDFIVRVYEGETQKTLLEKMVSLLESPFFQMGVAIVTCLVTLFLLNTYAGVEVVNKGETEKLMLYEQFEEDTNATTTFHQISNQQEYVTYMSDFEEWLDKKGE